MTDEILDKALELKERIKESDKFLSLVELMNPTDQRATKGDHSQKKCFVSSVPLSISSYCVA